MIKYKDGDLLKSDCTVIMHQANCFNTMGAGIARQIADLYPNAEKADREYPGTPKAKFGHFSYSKESDVIVVNLYGQYKFGGGRQTDYKALENAIDEFLKYAKYKDLDLSEVGVPYKMGCGLAGGSWPVVEGIIKRQANKHGVRISIYRL